MWWAESAQCRNRKEGISDPNPLTNILKDWQFILKIKAEKCLLSSDKLPPTGCITLRKGRLRSLTWTHYTMMMSYMFLQSLTSLFFFLISDSWFSSECPWCLPPTNLDILRWLRLPWLDHGVTSQTVWKVGVFEVFRLDWLRDCGRSSAFRCLVAWSRSWLTHTCITLKTFRNILLWVQRFDWATK